MFKAMCNFCTVNRTQTAFIVPSGGEKGVTTCPMLNTSDTSPVVTCLFPQWCAVV